jgi:hypothetical protein
LGVEGEDEEMAGLTISGIQNDFKMRPSKTQVVSA